MRILFRIVWIALAGVVALIALLIVGLNIRQDMRRAAKTIKGVGIITIPAPFRLRQFIDYMTVSGQRLYAGYTSQGMVGVIDTRTNRIVATITGLGRVHGIALVPGRGLGFATSSGDNKVNVFEIATDKLIKKIAGGDDPDAITYDTKLNLIYVSDHDGMTATVIDPETLAVVATIPLGGKAEYAQADPDTGLIYQNLESTSQLLTVNLQTRKVVNRYPLSPGEGPTGLGLDAADHRLFVACRSKLIVLDARTGAVVAVLPIGAGTDGADYDPVLHRVYTANAIGTMTVIQQESADHYRVLENAPTHIGGHSLVIDPTTHRIYVDYFGSIAVYAPVKS